MEQPLRNADLGSSEKKIGSYEKILGSCKRKSFRNLQSKVQIIPCFIRKYNKV